MPHCKETKKISGFEVSTSPIARQWINRVERLRVKYSESNNLAAG